MVRIGVISDTHGLLRPEARTQLAGSFSVAQLIIDGPHVDAKIINLLP